MGAMIPVDEVEVAGGWVKPAFPVWEIWSRPTPLGWAAAIM